MKRFHIPYNCVFEADDGIWMKHADHEAALKAAVAKEREAHAMVLRKVLLAVGAKIGSERMASNDEGIRCSWIEMGENGILDISNEYAELLVKRCPAIRARGAA